MCSAYTALMRAVRGAGIDEHRIAEQFRGLTAGPQPGNQFLKSILDRHLPP